MFLRGQCPQDLDSFEDLGSHDPAEQAHLVMRNVARLIEEAGGRMEHLCKVVVYLTDVRHREPVYRAMGEHLRGVHPVSTGLVVSALARPGWLVEIDATAVIPDEEDAASPAGSDRAAAPDDEAARPGDGGSAG